MKRKILLVDDEKDILEFLSYNLKLEDFDVITADSGEVALKKLKHKPDLIILDVMMPKLNGYQVCEKIRKIKEFDRIPIIFLTALGNEKDEIKGLEIGGDDFIVKPVSVDKLIARVNSNLRTKTTFNSENQPNILTVGPISINNENFTVHVSDKEIFFPRKEFEILTLLVSSPNKVLNRDKILDSVWGPDVFVIPRTVDVHIRKIRQKLGNYSNLIETIKGVGYKFKI